MMAIDSDELEERARKCMEAAFHAAECAGGDTTFGDIRNALRVIYGEEAFERAKEMMNE